MLTNESFDKMPKELMLKMAARAIGLDYQNSENWNPLENLADATSLCDRLNLYFNDSDDDAVRVVDSKFCYEHVESSLYHRGHNQAFRLCVVRVAANRWYQQAMQDPSRPMLDLPWKWIDKAYQYAAMDELGDVYLYTKQPYIDFFFDNYRKVGSWHGAELGDMLDEYVLEIEKDGIDWMLSLTKRPD